MATNANGVTMDVKFFGAKGDGVTDDSDAFIRAIAALEAAVVVNPAQAALAGDSNRRGRMTLIIPEGCYVITKPEALMRGSYSTRTVGFTVLGAGRSLTQIYYKNSQVNRYLLSNNDAWLSVIFSNIEFTSNNVNNNFMLSNSRGGAQNYLFEKCSWNGSWNYLFHLIGTNNNSEMTWFHCNFNQLIKKVIYVPTTNGSDQFVNYNFLACNYEVSEGDYLHFEKGGNINIWGGSVIHFGANAGTFFRLYGNSHNYGTQRFQCSGVRFEHRNTNSKLIDCKWNDGAVSFIGCDMSTSAFMVPATAVNSTFTSANQKMPSIKFDNCMLMGKHEYIYNVNSWNFPHNVIYENCEFVQVLNAVDFIKYTSISGNIGGQPQIKFSNCRGQNANATTVFFDTDLGGKNVNRAQLTKKVISIKDANGNLPRAGGSETFLLPPGALILNVKFLSPAGAVSSGAAADYRVQTSEPTPTVIASVNVTPARNGFNVSRDVLFQCNTEQRRQLKLVAGANVDQLNNNAYCLIEYVS
jgi:hypothetical protein